MEETANARAVFHDFRCPRTNPAMQPGGHGAGKMGKITAAEMTSATGGTCQSHRRTPVWHRAARSPHAPGALARRPAIQRRSCDPSGNRIKINASVRNTRLTGRSRNTSGSPRGNGQRAAQVFLDQRAEDEPEQHRRRLEPEPAAAHSRWQPKASVYEHIEGGVSRSCSCPCR